MNATRKAISAQRGGGRVRLFDFFKATVGWHDLHPGYRENSHRVRCDCQHFCYSSERWEALLHELAAASTV